MRPGTRVPTVIYINDLVACGLWTVEDAAQFVLLEISLDIQIT